MADMIKMFEPITDRELAEHISNVSEFSIRISKIVAENSNPNIKKQIESLIVNFGDVQKEIVDEYRPKEKKDVPVKQGVTLTNKS